MQGSADDPGIIPHAFDHFFEFIAANQHNREFMVHVSYLEIYNEEIRDLLGVDHKQALALKETPDTGVYVKDLTEIAVGTTEEIYQIMEKGFKNRTVGSTLMVCDSCGFILRALSIKLNAFASRTLALLVRIPFSRS